MTETKTPKGRTPKDTKLWQWAWEMYGSSWSNTIARYKEAYKDKYGKNDGFNKRR